MLSRSRLPWMNLRGYPVRTGTLVLFSMLMTMTIFGGTLIVQGIEHGLRSSRAWEPTSWSPPPRPIPTLTHRRSL